MIARLAYVTVFIGALPVLLVLWARRLDALLDLPTYGSPELGLAVAVVGATVMTTGMLNLWVYGQGLPASPFPPERLVTGGIYRIVADPIYIGAVLVCAGISFATRSGAGLWVVSPTLALAAASFVIGFERGSTRRRHGAVATPLLRLPPATDAKPTAWDRISVYVLVFLPSLVLYEAVDFLGVPGDARSAFFPWEARVPVVPWTEAIYAAVYPVTFLAPLLAARQRDLRRFGVGGLWATAVIISVSLLVPLVARAKPVPASHVVWACLSAQLFASRWPRSRWIWWTAVALVAASCVTNGMHAVVAVVGGLAAYGVVETRAPLWRRICDGAEVVANSFREETLGVVRFMNHGIYAGVGTVIGLGVAVSLVGGAQLWWLVALTLAAVLGGALWAQWVEGSSQLLRPYGYFGSVFGAIGVGLVAGATHADVWPVVTAFAVGATFTQAIGRMRCLVQGCCHGRKAPAALGIRYTHPRSRVVRLSALAGTPLHPTPIYSAVWTAFVGALLVRLWMLTVPLQFILGSYFVLIGVGRFAEEHFRGEPQTAIIAGLRLYQWLAIAFVIGGAAVMTLGAKPAPGGASFDPTALPILFVVGVVSYAALGMDFPKSNRRFARLL